MSQAKIARERLPKCLSNSPPLTWTNSHYILYGNTIQIYLCKLNEWYYSKSRNIIEILRVYL